MDPRAIEKDRAEKLHKKILSLNGPGQWGGGASRGVEKWDEGAVGAPGCVHAEENREHRRREEIRRDVA